MSGREQLDLDAFRALHPWPEEHAHHGRRMEVLWRFELSCTPAALWPFVADTSRFNRALGLPAMRFEERGGVRYGEASYGGIRAVWREEPWQWVREHYLRSVRVFERGFARLAYAVFHIEPLDDARSRLYTYFGMVPRGVIGRVWTALGLRSLASGYRRAMSELERELLAERRARPMLLTVEALDTRARARAAALRDGLVADTGNPELVDRLLEYVATGDELSLYRLQVPALAHEWGVDADQLLRVCLYATRHGLLELSWDVICPHCRGVRQETRNLGDVPSKGECEVCDIDFSTEPEDAIEIAFHVHPAIRDIPKQLFCSAEPSFKEHIHLQVALEPGEEKTLATALERGRYRLRLEGEKRYRLLDIRADEGLEAGAGSATWRAQESSDLETAPRPRLRLHNDSDAPRTFIIENLQWLDFALRPARLFNLQDFRDLFAEEYLAADVRLAVGSQAILFTDMVGSTRFYADRGDPAAFAEIKRHFSELEPIVAAHRGAVVKTVGDAVMASFSSALDAVRAAEAIHACFHEQRDDSPIRLRVSLNVGPCIAVNLNSGIDYFGGTVNIAAKLQACADAGDIAMSREVYESEGVRAYLRDRAAFVERDVYHSHALCQDLPVFLWRTFTQRPARMFSHPGVIPPEPVHDLE